MLDMIIILLIVFQLKHFVCDYPLQNSYMLNKTRKDGWFLPLLAHASVHAIFTFSIVFMLVSFKLAILLALADLTIHFIIDRIKASPSLGGKFSPSQPYFWWSLGIDQMAHHLTHYLFIFIIVTTI